MSVEYDITLFIAEIVKVIGRNDPDELRATMDKVNSIPPSDLAPLPLRLRTCYGTVVSDLFAALINI